MYITNYEDLTPECQELVRACGFLGDAIASPEIPISYGMIVAFRDSLKKLSVESKRPIEALSVRGESWINVREPNSVSREKLEAIFSAKPIKQEESNLKHRIQSQWRW